MSLLDVNNLAVHGLDGEVVAPISMTINPGQSVLLIGETGSGKSLFAQSLLGTLPKGLTATGGLSILGKRYSVTAADALAHLWGHQISVLPQEPWRALDPLMRSRRQVEEVYRLVSKRADARAAADADLDAMDLADAADRFPFELSGGMAQRLAIAAARAGGAQIVVADEPTKGLDLARRNDVARRMRTVTEAGGGLITITHDLEFAEALGGEVIVLREGQIIERGPCATGSQIALTSLHQRSDRVRTAQLAAFGGQQEGRGRHQGGEALCGPRRAGYRQGYRSDDQGRRDRWLVRPFRDRKVLTWRHPAGPCARKGRAC